MTDSTPSTTSTASAPAAAPSAAPASAPSAAPSSSSSPDTSQTAAPSWESAFEAVGLTGSPTSDDATAEAPTTPVPATVEPPPDATAPVQAPLDAKGPIPFDRHTAILENTRRKAAEEVAGRVEQQFGPAIQLQQRMQTDPIGTLTQLIDEAIAHPEIGQQVVSQLARTLGGRRAAKGPDLTPIDTEVGPVYTADQVEAFVAQQIAQRVAPIEQERQARAEEARIAQMQQQTRQTVTSRLKHWETRPGFSEHKADIAQAQQAYVEQGVDTWSALGLAYADVYEAKVRPKQQAAQTTQFVQSAVAKAQASTGNPGVVAPTTNRRPTTWDEAFKQAGLA